MALTKLDILSLRSPLESPLNPQPNARFDAPAAAILELRPGDGRADNRR
jgi:hypothetical protein